MKRVAKTSAEPWILITGNSGQWAMGMVPLHYPLWVHDRNLSKINTTSVLRAGVHDQQATSPKQKKRGSSRHKQLFNEILVGD